MLLVRQDKRNKLQMFPISPHAQQTILESKERNFLQAVQILRHTFAQQSLGKGGTGKLKEVKMNPILKRLYQRQTSEQKRDAALAAESFGEEELQGGAGTLGQLLHVKRVERIRRKLFSQFFWMHSPLDVFYEWLQQKFPCFSIILDTRLMLL